MKHGKTLRNYFLAAILGIGSIIEATSGFVLWFALPHIGGGGGRGASAVVQTFWSLPRTTWTSLHDWAAVALVAVVIVHVALHWKWFVRVTKLIAREVRGGLRGTPVAAGETVDLAK